MDLPSVNMLCVHKYRPFCCKCEHRRAFMSTWGGPIGCQAAADRPEEGGGWVNSWTGRAGRRAD